MKIEIKIKPNKLNLSHLNPGDVFRLDCMDCVLIEPHPLNAVISYGKNSNRYVYMGLANKTLYATDDNLVIEYLGELHYNS